MPDDTILHCNMSYYTVLYYTTGYCWIFWAQVLSAGVRVLRGCLFTRSLQSFGLRDFAIVSGLQAPKLKTKKHNNNNNNDRRSLHAQESLIPKLLNPGPYARLKPLTRKPFNPQALNA